MWSRLISTFMHQFDTHGAFDFSALEPFDINKDNTFEKLMELTPKVRVDKKKSVLEVNLSYPAHPPVKKVGYLHGYRFTVVGVFPDVKKNSARTAVSCSDISLTGNVVPVNVQLPIPRGAKIFLVCLRIDGCRYGKVDGPDTMKAMKMIEAGWI